MVVHESPCSRLIERPHERHPADEWLEFMRDLPVAGRLAAQPRCMYPDEYLHHYADRFVRLGLSQYVTLAEYLAQPSACEADARRRDYDDYIRRVSQDLHREVQRRRRDFLAEKMAGPLDVERDVENLPRRNGTAIEPMHSRRHPRRPAGSGFRPRQPAETIGACDWCGHVDHHLVAGECPDCRARSETRPS